MRFKGLDLNLLVVLDKLLTYRSVTQTAELLHVTQSAASSALARLRESLGDELLVQSGRQMLLTRFGEELREQVREILTWIDATMSSNPNFDPAASQRHFRVVCSDFVADVVMARALREIERLAPGVSLDLMPPVSMEIFTRLQRGEVDLVIAPDYYCSAQHLQAQLFSDPFVCVAWSGNSSVGETIDVEQYASMDHVVLQPFGQVALDQHYLDERKLSRRVMASVPVFGLLLKLLVGTKRIATVPSRLVDDYAHLLQLKSAQLAFEMPPLTESMQWHPSRDRDMALSWLRKVIREASDEFRVGGFGGVP